MLFIHKILILSLLPFLVCAQKISNVRAEYDAENEKINVYYDLEGNLNQRFDVTIYASSDNYKNPLVFVSGDVGSNIEQGQGKKIVWDYKEEIGELSTVDFDVRAITEIEILQKDKPAPPDEKPEKEDKPAPPDEKPEEQLEQPTEQAPSTTVESVKRRREKWIFTIEGGGKMGDKFAPQMALFFGHQWRRTSLNLGLGFSGNYGLADLKQTDINGLSLPISLDFRYYFSAKVPSVFTVAYLGRNPTDQYTFLGLSLGYQASSLFFIRTGLEYGRGNNTTKTQFTNTVGTPEQSHSMSITRVLYNIKIGFTF